MRLRLSISIPGLNTSPILIVCCAEGDSSSGKFLLGRSREDHRQIIAVFDDSAAFHKDLAESYGLRPLGGGWCEIDHAGKRVVISGRSTQFGREPDRSLIVSLFQQAFPDYSCWHED